MHESVNLLTDRDYDFAGSAGDWVETGPHTLSVSREQVRWTDLSSLKVVSADGSDIVLESPTIPVGQLFGWRGRALVWLFPERDVSVTVDLIVALSSVATTSSTCTARANKWNICDTWSAVILEGSTAKMRITVSGLSTGEALYVTNPVLTAPDAISRNVFSAETYMRLPEYMRHEDAAQANPDFPLLRFIDAITSESNEIMYLWDHYRYIPPEDGGLDELASLLDPSRASFDILRWEATILGIKFYNPISGVTTWSRLEAGLNPGNTPTWSDLETAPDTGDPGTDVSWEEVEDFAPDTSDLLASLRWQVQTAYNGIRGGMRESILETVKHALTGTKTATFYSHNGGDPWSFRVETLQSETPDTPTIGTASATILEMVEKAVPAGYEFVHETISG